MQLRVLKKIFMTVESIIETKPLEKIYCNVALKSLVVCVPYWFMQA